jgi:hypothetical protein
MEDFNVKPEDTAKMLEAHPQNARMALTTMTLPLP